MTVGLNGLKVTQIVADGPAIPDSVALDVTYSGDDADLDNVGGPGVLDDLADVTITSPVDGNRLRFNGTTWVNTSLIWRPVMSYDGTNWLVAVDGGGNAVLTEA